MLIIRTSPKKLKHVKGLLRAGAYIAGLSLVITGIQIRSARAEVKDRTVELGRQMITLAEATQHDVNKVVLNGQTMWVGSSLSDDTAKKILDRYEAYCGKNGAHSSAEWRALANDNKAAADKPFLSTGILRGGDDREGTVTCFTKTDASKPSVAEAVKAFAETGDLGALGAARYVYVKSTDSGRSVVLTAWTDDKFNILDLVGEEGKDVAGAEFSEIPRVPSSQRVFSARLEGTPFGMNVYRSKESPSAVAKYFDTELQVAGWAAIDVGMEKREGSEEGPQVGRVYEKDNVVLTLASKADPKDGTTFTALGLAGVGAVHPGGQSGANKNVKIH
ncbi:MAG: hypothetical protein KF819_19645 [Labilithrix sp.]|nr:hypothetical protein [Labilithrix sp.]